MLYRSPLANKNTSNNEDARAGGVGAPLKRCQGSRIAKPLKNNAPIKFGTLPIRPSSKKLREADEDVFGKVERKKDTKMRAE